VLASSVQPLKVTLVPETAKTSPKHSKTVHTVAKHFSLLVLCHPSEAEGCVESKGMSKGRAIPKGTVGSSSGRSLGSKALPRGRELCRGASAQWKAQSAGRRQDLGCAVSSLLLPCREQWPQQETGSCGQSGQWVGAVGRGSSAWPGAGGLELQHREGPCCSCEQALGCREGKVLAGGEGKRQGWCPQGPTELPGHWTRQGQRGPDPQSPQKRWGCTPKQDLCRG